MTMDDYRKIYSEKMKTEKCIERKCPTGRRTEAVLISNKLASKVDANVFLMFYCRSFL